MTLINEDNDITCEAAREHVTAFMDREPVPSSVIRHLTECPTCAAVWKEQDAVLSIADTWHVEERDVWSAIRGRLTDEPNKRGWITAGQLFHARRTAAETGCSLGQTLVNLGYANERDVSEAAAEANGLPLIDLTRHKPEVAAIASVPVEVARKHRLLPVKKDGNILWVAAASLPAVDGLDEIRLATRCIVRPMLAARSEFDRAFEEAYGSPPAEREPEPTSPPAELSLVLEELRSMRTEMEAIRGEVAHLRRQIASREPTMKPPRTTPAVTHRLFPFAPSSERPDPRN